MLLTIAWGSLQQSLEEDRMNRLVENFPFHSRETKNYGQRYSDDFWEKDCVGKASGSLETVLYGHSYHMKTDGM